MGDVVDFIVDAVSSVFNFAADLIGGIFNSLFGGLYDQPGFNDNQNQTVTVQQSDAARRFVFGETRLGMIAFERAKPSPTSDILYFAGIFCEGKSTISYLYWEEELICLETLANDGNGHPIYTPKTAPCYVVETRWTGTSKLYFVADQAALDAVGSTHDGNPVMRKYSVDSSKFAGFMYIRKYDGTQTVADHNMVANLTHWTTDHKLTGICYAVFAFQKSATVFPRGVENISARVQGIEVLDPRDSVTRWTANPALLWYWWKTNQLHGRAVPTADIDIESVKTAADICDESVATVYGGTEPRYSCHGVFDTSNEPSAFEKDLLVTMDGVSANLGGLETLIAGKHVTPTFTIEAKHAIGAITSKTRLPRKDQVEVVKGTYLAPDNNWKKTSFPTVKAAATAVTDEKVINLDLRLVSSPSQAQRLATRVLKRAQLEKRMSGVFDGEALRAISGKPVAISMGSRFPLNGAEALVLGWALTASRDGKLGVQMSLRETSSAIDTFDESTEETAVTVGTKTAEDAPQVSAPTSTPASGVLVGTSFPTNITLAVATDGATIRWSRGTAINTVTDGNAYSTAISVEKGETLLAKAFKDDFEDSESLIATFDQAKVESVQFSLSGGEYPDGYFPQDVSLTCATAGASIRYSTSAAIVTDTDGSAYSSPLTVPINGQTIYARAFKGGYTESDQTNVVYTESA